MTTPTRPTLPPSKPLAAPPSAPVRKQFGVSSATTRKAFKTGIYGPEGIGKSSLMAALGKNLDSVADIEGSQQDFATPKVTGIENWSDLRAWVQSLTGGIHGIDSITRAEDWAAQYVIETKKSNEGAKASDSLEDFKYGAGMTFVADEFRKLLADIDAAVTRGTSFVIIAHARITKTKNPDGSDFVRYEPRLIDTPKASNMLQFVQFLDHLAFVQLDMSVSKDRKVTGSGSRTIYLDTAPQRVSKCRGISNDPIPFPEGDDAFWRLVLPTIGKAMES